MGRYDRRCANHPSAWHRYYPCRTKKWKVPVVSSGGVSSYHDVAAVAGPGVVLGRKGVVGSVYFVASDFWPHDTTLWGKDFHGNDPRFVYYFFKWMAPRIATMDVGSANPKSRPSYKDFLASCPRTV